MRSTFRKGTVDSYHYKNLSGGEKAAFDLILDIHLKKSYFKNAIYCIDELESHLHTKVQGSLLKELCNIVPATSQLWVTTHSLGVLREAQEMEIDSPGSVCLIAETAYGSGRNAFEASRRGTELVSPVAGSAPGNSHEGEGDGPPPLTAADFQIDVTGEQATVCPAGHPSIEEYELKDAPERVEVHFAGTTCEPCPLRSRCPVKLDRRAGAYVLKADLVKVNIERRRRAEATEEWRKRYDIRAGIEGTNSELKRAHGLGRLRVRGGRRVRLAVYLKALACNFKRMVHARLVEMENTAQRSVGTVPTVAAA